MKKRILAALVVIAALGVGKPLFAQDNDGDKPRAPVGTKIGAINLAKVFQNYVRVKELQKEIQSLEPYKKAQAITGFYPPERRFSPWTNEDRKAKGAKQLELDRLKAELTRLIEEKCGEKKEIFRKEIQVGIEAVAKAYGFQIVFAYGDVPTLVEFDSPLFRLDWIPKKDDAVKAGWVPVYVDGSVDLTEAVIVTLNNWRNSEKQSKEK